jgi:hypothetical protein
MSIVVRPATKARFDDVAIMLGPKNPNSSVCWCLSHRLDWKTNRALAGPARGDYVRELCGRKVAPGVLAYSGDEVAGGPPPPPGPSCPSPGRLRSRTSTTCPSGRYGASASGRFPRSGRLTRSARRRLRNDAGEPVGGQGRQLYGDGSALLGVAVPWKPLKSAATWDSSEITGVVQGQGVQRGSKLRCHPASDCRTRGPTKRIWWWHAGTPAADAARRSTWWPRCAACTSGRSRTA